MFRYRPLAVAALGMLGGLLLARVMPDVRAAYVFAGVLMALALIAAIMHKRGAMLLFAFCALALFLMTLRAIDPPVQGRYAASGRICETPQRSGSGWALTLDHVSIGGAPRAQRLRLYTGPGVPAYGQWIEAEASFRAPEPQFVSSYAYRGISDHGYARGFTVLRQDPPDAYGALLALRERAAAQIGRLFPASGGVAAAMLLGDKSGMAEGAMDAYRASGAAHLLATSGLHVSVLASAFSLLFRRRAWLRFLALALFLACYAALTAFSPSVLRAGIMLLCGRLARPLRMHADRPSALSLAFVLVLTVNPHALFYAGFQLSFLAAYGLTLLGPGLKRRFLRFGERLSGVLSGSVAVWLATLPAQAAFFGEISLVSFLSNLFILPVVPFFLIPAFLLTLLSLFSFPLASALAFLPRWALSVIDFLARTPGFLPLRLPAPTLLSMLFYFAAMLFISRLCMRRRARRALYAGACLLAAIVFWSL